MSIDHINPASVFSALEKLKKNSPLVHHITNMVVMQTNANCLLALGASPLMAHAHEELDDILSIAQSLVLNIGTLDKQWIKACQQAQHYALQKNKPIILDPVGAGASLLRTSTAKNLLQAGVSAVRGNASEILALHDASIQSKGVDSLHQSHTAIGAAHALSQHYQCVVIISGEHDYICYQNQTLCLSHGHPLLTKVTGMGCSATSIIAAFLTIESDPVFAATCGILALNIAAQKAAQNAQGPGSFYVNLLDALSALEASDFKPLNIKHISDG